MKTRAFLVLWGAGLVGVASFLPVIAALVPHNAKQQIPIAVILVLALAQNAVIVGVATATVVFLGHAIGLRTPVVEAWASRRPIGPELPRVIGPGLVAGVLGGVFATLAAPDLVAYLHGVPLYARLLYGGIVEELVMRGGLMTLLTWGAYRVLQRRGDAVRLPAVAIGVVLSDAIFAVGHIPVLTMSHSPSPHRTAALIFIIALPWGWLYFRRGLEAAMVAHAGFHAVVATIAALR